MTGSINDGYAAAMSTQKWVAQAPTNIAWIKYMGKRNEATNLPINASLSYSLPYLHTRVEIEKISGTADIWERLVDDDLRPTEFPKSAIDRYLKHFEFLKKTWGMEKHFYCIRSANNFSADCGMASSASSFAALTKAAALAFQDESAQKSMPTLRDLSKLSRQGSGSSCRSFFDSWALWSGEAAEPLELPFQNLIHIAALVDNTKKTISSTEAHRMIQTSLLFEGRAQRAESRLGSLLTELRSENWEQCFKICFQEFWDMHALFLTSTEPFSFLRPSSLECINSALEYWREHRDGPVITVDAGANVHFFFRHNQESCATWWLEKLNDNRVQTVSNLSANMAANADADSTAPTS